jgi:hypothetical protein
MKNYSWQRPFPLLALDPTTQQPLQQTTAGSVSLCFATPSVDFPSVSVDVSLDIPVINPGRRHRGWPSGPSRASPARRSSGRIRPVAARDRREGRCRQKPRGRTWLQSGCRTGESGPPGVSGQIESWSFHNGSYYSIMRLQTISDVDKDSRRSGRGGGQLPALPDARSGGR